MLYYSEEIKYGLESVNLLKTKLLSHSSAVIQQGYLTFLRSNLFLPKMEITLAVMLSALVINSNSLVKAIVNSVYIHVFFFSAILLSLFPIIKVVNIRLNCE